MRRDIVAHDVHITPGNVNELREMDFVFLCLDSGRARKLIVDRLEEWGVSFIDVGMGVYETDGSLGGLVRVTASTPRQRRHIHDRDRIPFGDGDANNEYGQNIQIAELNSLNATLAVIKFKKLLRFFVDLEGEHNAIYEIDGNNAYPAERRRPGRGGVMRQVGHRFVEFVPDDLEPETLYVSMEYATAVHSCCVAAAAAS